MVPITKSLLLWFTFFSLLLYPMSMLRATETEKLQQFEKRFWDYRTSDKAKTLHEFTQALHYAKQINNIEWEARYLQRLGVIYSEWGQTDSAFYYLDTALQLIEGKNFFATEAFNYQQRGVLYIDKNQHEQALSLFFQSMELNKKALAQAQTSTNTDPLAKAYRFQVALLVDIGGVYYSLHNQAKAIDYLVQAQKIIEEQTEVNFESLTYRVLGNLAGAYLDQGDKKLALPLLLESYRLAKAKNNTVSSIYALQRLSDYYRDENLSLSLQYAQTCMQLAQQTKMPKLLNLAEGTLMDSYLVMHNFSQALIHAQNIEQRTEEDDWETLEYLYADCILIYASLLQLDKTDEYLEKYRQLIGKLSDDKLHTALQEMEVKYQVAEKQLLIDRQQAEITQQKTYQTLLAVGMVSSLLIILLLLYILFLRNKQAKVLEETNATKDRFFTILSHDLKNPVLAQRNALQLLVENGGDWTAESVKLYHHELLKSVDDQIELLYNLLNWAQVQTGRMPYLPLEFDVVRALQVDLDLLNQMARQKDVSLDIQTPESLIVFGDSYMLCTVVRNLITNAIKFTKPQGRVWFTIEKVEGKHRFMVSDTGIGISPEFLSRLFTQKNTRAQRGTRGELGSGLGLQVAKELLAIHGCTLEVQSEPDTGSRFWFEL